MNRKSDLQTVMHQFLPGYREQRLLTPRQAEVCTHIGICRSEALGGVQPRGSTKVLKSPSYKRESP